MISNSTFFQMDVWIEGERVGYTPVTVELPVGRHFATLGADGVQPVFLQLDVTDTEEHLAMFTPEVITEENLEEFRAQVDEKIAERPDDPSLYLLALSLIEDPAMIADYLDALDGLVEEDGVRDAHLARMYIHTRELNRALEHARRAVELEPEFGFTWRVKADALRLLGRNAEALEAAQKAVVLDPQNWRQRRALARAYRALGLRNEAEREWDAGEQLYSAMHVIYDHSPPEEQ